MTAELTLVDDLACSVASGQTPSQTESDTDTLCNNKGLWQLAARETIIVVLLLMVILLLLFCITSASITYCTAPHIQ